MYNGLTRHELLFIKKIIDRACREQTKLMRAEEMEDFESRARENPERYYSFKYGTRGLCITVTKYAYNEKTKQYERYNSDFYCIETYGYTPSNRVTNNCKYYSYTNKYGAFEDLDECLVYYKRFLVDFIQKELRLPIYEQPDLMEQTPKEVLKEAVKKWDVQDR